MRKISKLVCAGTCAIFTLICGVYAEEQSTEIKLEQVPAAAQKTIQEKVGGENGKLGEIDLVTDDGETSYDVTLVKGKIERDFTVAPDGKLLSWQVFMNEIPESARMAIRRHLRQNQGKQEEIDRVMDEDKVTFEVTMTKDEKESSFTVSESGRLLAIDVTLEETPEAVQKAIKAQLGDGKMTMLEKNTEDEGGKVAYDVEADKGGKKISFSVDAEGKLLDD